MSTAGSLPEVTVRRATEADALAVAQVLIESRAASAGAIPPSVYDDEDVRAWVADVVLPSHEVWLAVAPIGVMAALVLRDDWLEQLYVAPAWWGQGVGSVLVALAKQQRPDGLQLWTFASNRGAQRFYERHGFAAVEHTDGAGNEEGAPDIRYVWPSPEGQ
jgi:GNAT superfamily N-acetyltransferase